MSDEPTGLSESQAGPGHSHHATRDPRHLDILWSYTWFYIMYNVYDTSSNICN